MGERTNCDESAQSMATARFGGATDDVDLASSNTLANQARAPRPKRCRINAGARAVQTSQDSHALRARIDAALNNSNLCY